MTRASVLVFAATLGCGGLSGGPDDASVDASIADSALEAQQCIPFVIAPSDSGLGACDDSGCSSACWYGLSEPYTVCTSQCSDRNPCPKGFVCDLPLPWGVHEFDCFPECDDAGTCPSPLRCGGYTSSNVCH